MLRTIAVARGIAVNRGLVGDSLTTVPWVAQWKFNGDGLDSIGANHLTNNNSATFAQGKLGGATGATQLVAASSQYWSIADNAALSTGDIDFTVLAWIYFDTKSANRAFVQKSGNGVTAEYLLQYFIDTDRLRFIVYNSNASLSTVVSADALGSPSLATWYCVAAWHNTTDDTINIQVNDGAVNSAARTVTISDTASLFAIGVESYAGFVNYWNGRIDNVCIAKSAAGGGGVLSAAQRTAFYNAGVGTEVLI